LVVMVYERLSVLGSEWGSRVIDFLLGKEGAATMLERQARQGLLSATLLR